MTFIDCLKLTVCDILLPRPSDATLHMFLPMLFSTDVILHPVVCYFRCLHSYVQLLIIPASFLQVWKSARICSKDINNNNNIATSVFVILLVVCSCNSVRLALKLIKGNLLTYLQEMPFSAKAHSRQRLGKQSGNNTLPSFWGLEYAFP